MTSSLFLKYGFAHCKLDLGPRGLKRLAEISQVPNIACSIKRLSLGHVKDVDRFVDDYGKPVSEPNARKALAQSDVFDLDENEFVGRSGSDALTLAPALTRLQNVKEMSMYPT